jgi:uncharacterized spore protein YtfJ
MNEFFQSIIDRLQNSASIKTVYGEPAEVKGRTIIPVAKIAYAFCSSTPSSQESDGQGHNRGGGAIAVKPAGIIEITQDAGTRFIPIKDTEKLIGMLLLGLMLGTIVSGRRSRRRD